jgi:hypothetical protein
VQPDWGVGIDDPFNLMRPNYCGLKIECADGYPEKEGTRHPSIALLVDSEIYLSCSLQNNAAISNSSIEQD